MTAAQRDERLPERWRDQLQSYGPRSQSASESYPRAANAGFRLDALPEGPDAVIGSDPAFAATQLLDQYEIDFAILNPSTLLMCHEVPEFAEALARATNDWLLEVWLDSDPRYLGAVVVPIEHPDVAAREIERCAGDPRWVQVIVPAGTQEGLGSPKYRPLYAAAAEHGLPVAVHFGGIDLHAGPGWPSYYIEEHVAYAVRIQSQVLNLICSGIFEDLPDLKFVLTEFGFAWFPAFRSSVDEAWSEFGDELPHLARKPSEILHDHFWLTTQPVDEPDDPSLFPALIKLGDLEDRLLFSTDYPHWDFDSPTQALPRTVRGEVRNRIFAGNACELHRLPRQKGID
jgi:predicted TIM-barrel fold metal-dependent hydrolase